MLGIRSRVSLLALLETAVLLVNTAAADVESGMVHHYPFDGNPGDITPVNSPNYVPGAHPCSGVALSVNGTQYVQADFAGYSQRPITVAFWVKPPADTIESYLVNNHGTGTLQGWSFVTEADERFKFFLGFGSGYTLLTRPFSQLPHPRLSANNQDVVRAGWYHLAATIDASGNAILYVNGEPEASRNDFALLQVTDPNVKLTVGARWDGVHPFQGAIDELRVYNSVLSDPDVKLLATPCPEPAALSLLALGGVTILRRRRR